MGRSKPWLPIAGELMLPRVVRSLHSAVDPVMVVAAPGQDVPPLPPETEIVRDEQPDRGPLQGVAAGLAALQGRAAAAYVSSCDVPFLRGAFVRRLIELRGNAAICVPQVGGHSHPLAAVYRVDVLDVVRELLRRDQLAPRMLFDMVPTRVVEAAELADVDPSIESLRNVNTPEEYERAVRELSSSEPPA